MTAGRIWAASLAIVLGSLAVVAVWHHPALFLWYLAVAGFVVTAALAIAADHFRHQRDEARAELDRRADLSDELVSAVAMAESLADELSHADRTIRNLAAQVAAKAEKPALHIVPPQRSDSWLEQVMDEQAALGAEQSGDAS